MQFTRAQRLAFRFTFVYLLLYVSPLDMFTLIPGLEWISKGYQGVWDRIIQAAATHVFRIEEVSFEPTGSGDTTAAYIQLACAFVFALLAAVVWSLIARRPPYRDRDLSALLRIYIRYSLGMILLGYGFAKVFKSQFPDPRPEQLLTPFGNASPMGLLWRFMGFSTAYTVFTGLAEVAGGVLLFFRRTTTLGALVLVGVMINVVMLNFCYDVPVKVYSAHLLLMAFYLLLPDARRLANVLILNRPAPAADLRPPDILVKFHRWHIVIKPVLIVAMVGSSLYGGYEAYTQWGPGAPKTALYGAYEVEAFIRNGVTIEPVLSEATRWRRLTVNNFMWSAFLMDDTPRRYAMEHDEAAGKVTLKEGPEKQYVVTVARPDPDHLRIEGKIGDDQLEVRLKKMDLGGLPLTGRGFHWINEFPYNR